jgi:hypothetical protein
LSSTAQPVDIIGSSIGAWRYANYCKANFRTAFEDFERIYFSQTYQEGASLEQISDEIIRLLNEIFPAGCEAEILANPKFRMNIFADRSRGMMASDNPALLIPGLVVATALNMLHPKPIGWFFERYLFQHPSSGQLINSTDFSTQRPHLTETTLKPAILASGAIPMVVNGIEIPGIKGKGFRDGGLLDYHLTLDYQVEDGLILMPHFVPGLITNWLDKYAPWRTANLKGMSRVLVLCPTRDFIEKLPLAKIPDRTDFDRFKSDDRARNEYWHEVTQRSQQLADDFNDLLHSERLETVLKPLEAITE